MKLIRKKLKRIKTLMKGQTFSRKNPIIIQSFFFQKKKIAISKKDLKNPCITTGIKISSRQRQRLCEKVLKN